MLWLYGVRTMGHMQAYAPWDICRRALLADEMGLGKTVQAIAAAAAYVSDWPLLVACPASARLHWRDELLRWLPTLLGAEDVCVVLSGRQALPRASVYILSYDLVPRMRRALEALRPQAIICDESQCLKSRAALRTKAMLPLLKAARRAVLLSGTPALSRPVELFTQLHALDAAAFPLFKAFAQRYCDAKQGRYGLDASGCSHLSELHTMLFATVGLRRLKRDVPPPPPQPFPSTWVRASPSPSPSP